MEFTIFTPTYNRGYIIKNLYLSLKKQTYTDFEWIVIDDGSIDNTSEVFNEINQVEHNFPIIYKKVENKGKHNAVNLGVQMAKGRLFFIVDSDDYLPDNALETLLQYEQTIDNERKYEYAGVAGLRGKSDGSCLGSTFSGDYLDCTYLEAQSNNIFGDKSEVYYTDLIKKYPFPVFENEKFIPESVVWNVIAVDGYKIRYFNEITYYCDYLDDGLTKQGDEKYKSIPKGYGLYLHQSIKYGKLTKINKWKHIFNYYRMFNEQLSNREMAHNLHMNPLKFYFRILGIRIFYKLYNQ